MNNTDTQDYMATFKSLLDSAEDLAKELEAQGYPAITVGQSLFKLLSSQFAETGDKLIKSVVADVFSKRTTNLLIFPRPPQPKSE